MFYNDLTEKIGDHDCDFIIKIKMEADGAKSIEVTMKELKLFLKIDSLYIIQHFFTMNFPEYSKDAKDKPTYFEEDYGNYPRFSVMLKLVDCLTCFEQMCDSHT